MQQDGVRLTIDMVALQRLLIGHFHVHQGMFKDMVLHLGFTIEGRSADELPEAMLACCTLNYPSLERAVEFDV